jgi:hypothetical protein
MTWGELEDGAMRNKWFRRIRRFIELFTPGGVEYTRLGTEVHISSRGMITIPPSEYKKIAAAFSAEIKRARANSQQGTLPKDSG